MSSSPSTRTSKFAFAQLANEATRVTASAFLDALVAAVPYRIRTVLTPATPTDPQRDT